MAATKAKKPTVTEEVDGEREQAASAADLEPLRVALARAEQVLDDLAETEGELQSVCVAESEPGGDPIKLIEARRRLDDMPSFRRAARDQVHAARAALLDAEIANANIDIAQAEQAREAKRPAYDKAVAAFQALEDEVAQVRRRRDTLQRQRERLPRRRVALPTTSPALPRRPSSGLPAGSATGPGRPPR